MGGYTRVDITTLTESRLDSAYYSKRFLNNEAVLDRCGLKRVPIAELSALCNCGATPKNVVYGGTGTGLIRTSNVRPNVFHAHDVVRTEDILPLELRSSIKAAPGDLLYTMSGTIGYACVIPEDNEIYSFSNTIARVRLPDDSDNDTHYIAAFFNSFYGYEQSLRLTSGGIQGHVMPNPFKALKISLPHPYAQKYIGDKVRQAEQLRGWAKQLQLQISEKFSFLTKKLIEKKSIWRASANDLSPYRINPKQYDPVVLDMLEKAQSLNCQLVPLQEMLDDIGIAGGATPKGATYLDEGVLFARVQNVKPLALELSDAVFIDSATDDELKRSRCEKDDIVLTITGYPGTASLVTEQDLPVNINQHSVRLRLEGEYPAGYVCAAINSDFVGFQVDRAAIGGTRDALDYPSVKNLLIPVLSREEVEHIDQDVRSIIAANQLSKTLIASAKFMVELLIEGPLIEQQLIDAQAAVEADDASLDRDILARLTTKGLDSDGDPLFPNLDQLYDLLVQSQSLY